MKKKESTYKKAIGYYYDKEISMKVNGEEKKVKVKRYKKPSLSAQKKILEKNG